MRRIGKENLSNIVPRVLSLIRASPYLKLVGNRLLFNANLQDINFLEENGFRFNYEPEFAFAPASKTYCIEVSFVYWCDLFMRYSNPNFKNENKFVNELRTPLFGFEPKV